MNGSAVAPGRSGIALAMQGCDRCESGVRSGGRTPLAVAQAGHRSRKPLATKEGGAWW